MTESVPLKPMTECELCKRPLDYAPNPAWPQLKHLFKMNPAKGYWLPKEHAECVQRMSQQAQDEKDKRQRLERTAQIKRAMSELGFAQVLADKPFETFHVEAGNQRAHAALQGWTYSKTGILLHGGPGKGKSHLMAAFAKRWTDMGMNVAFQNMSLLLALLRRGYDDDLFNERLRFVSSQAQILVLDDLGAEKPTEWGEEKLYMIIDTRLVAGLPIFVTTNCTSQELESKFHPRILSRLKELCTWIEVGGRDWREQINKNREARGPGAPVGRG